MSLCVDQLSVSDEDVHFTPPQTNQHQEHQERWLVLPLHMGSVSFQYGSLALMHSIIGGPCSRLCPGSQVYWTTAPTPYSGSVVVKLPFWMYGS